MRPSAEQSDILALGLTSMRVRAGAGTGKTTTVAMAIANLVERHDIEPEHILGLTFTNKAAAELAQRVAELLPDTIDPSRQVEVHTYHGFAAQILSEFGPLAGVDPRSGIVTPTFARQLLRDVFHNLRHELLDITYAGTLDQIKNLGDRLGDHLMKARTLLERAPTSDEDEVWQRRVEMARTLSAYDAAKSELGVVDYSDLVTLSTTLLQEHGAIASSIASRYRVLVLDEYQDTNPAQRVLLTTLFAKGFPVIAVGDEDQTIYEWRGASAENFEKFLDHFRTPEGDPPHDKGLTLSRRSGALILDVANRIRKQANPAADALSPSADLECEVVAHWAPDAAAEAEWIARQFEALHSAGTPWRDMAILFRKNKDFAVVIDILARHDIPMEVANIGGLLSVPEISELRAWLTVLENPGDSAALAQILFGSKYMIGMADLATLSRSLPGSPAEDDDEVHPVTLIEAIENIDEIEGLGDEARQRLASFAATYRDLLVETQGRSLVEVCRLVLDRLRAWQDIEALPANPRLTARLNIYRFLDLAEDWSPLAGRPSLSAFLEYLELMEEEPAEELDSARLSGEDAVTLVTVHRAKGLEWPNVAVPALIKGNFPSASGAFPDPIRFPANLPPEFRLDAYLATMPEEETGRKAFFRERHNQQEWRVAYVAATRAMRRLFVSGAYWYGQPEVRKTPAEPSPLFELIAETPGVDHDGFAELSPRPSSLRSSEPDDAPDPLFESGWQAALRSSISDPEYAQTLAAEKGLNREVAAAVEEWQDRLFAIDALGELEEPGTDRTVSVTGLVTYAQCPLRYQWSYVDPLPRRANAAAQAGTRIHRQIELDQLGQVPFAEVDEHLYDAEEPVSPAGDRRTALSSYRSSRFARERADLVEAGFNLPVGDDRSIRGRIDAIYRDGTHWEIVDFKSGRRSDDPSRLVQLQAYAVAGHEVDLGLPPAETMDVTFAYLGDGIDEVTHRVDGEWLTQARSRLDSLTGSIVAGDFAPTPGSWCNHCDFLRFCPAGQAEVGE